MCLKNVFKKKDSTLWEGRTPGFTPLMRAASCSHQTGSEAAPPERESRGPQKIPALVLGRRVLGPVEAETAASDSIWPTGGSWHPSPKMAAGLGRTGCPAIPSPQVSFHWLG